MADWPERECVGCGVSFRPVSLRQTRCKSGCGRVRDTQSKDGARKRKQELHEVEFIAVDGEGVTRPFEYEEWDEEEGGMVTRIGETHDYVLLSVGQESLHKNGKVLTHEDIFAFLYEQYEAHPNAAFVGFALGYDFTMWLKSLSPENAASLLSKQGIADRQPYNTEMKQPFPVRDGGKEWIDGEQVFRSAKWEFDILGFKRFKLRPYIPYEKRPIKIVNHKDGSQTEQRVGPGWMYICDTFPYFQCSFLKAIKPDDRKGIKRIVSDEEYARIEQGKMHRSDARFDLDMIEYNLLENEVLARLMETLNEGFVTDNIRLKKSQWMGPGQAAQEWMRLIGVPSGEEVREVVPEWAREAGRKCYYGGWFEIFNHGPVPGTSYAYDINSAYPAVIAKLPCLLHGKWKQGKGKPRNMGSAAFRMVYGTFSGSDDWCGPLPFRESDGSILRPKRVRGWYWEHEVMASKRAGLIDRIQISEWVEYTPCECSPPMAAVTELYNGRLLVGKNSPQGKAKKLVYNSAYGKCAQSIGSPRFANSIYASLITAGCRTQILDAIATHPTKSASLLMVATDGIVFKEKHPNLDLDQERLGAWDYEEYQNLSLFMPGLYWHDDARAQIREGAIPALKSRGVSAKYLGAIIDTVDREWAKYNSDTPPPRVPLTVEWALIGAKQAIIRNAWHTCGQNVWNETRWVDGKPDNKRMPHLLKGTSDSWGGLRSMPYAEGSQLETTYYEPTFGDDRLDADPIGDLITQDGTIGDMQAHALGLR